VRLDIAPHAANVVLKLPDLLANGDRWERQIAKNI
jgi:hypothetical protein